MAAKNTLLSSDIFGGHSVGGVGGVANITANPLVAPQVGPGAHPWVAPQGGLGAALGGVGTSIGAVLAQGGGGTQFGGQGGELSAAWWPQLGEAGAGAYVPGNVAVAHTHESQANTTAELDYLRQAVQVLNYFVAHAEPVTARMLFGAMGAADYRRFSVTLDNMQARGLLRISGSDPTFGDPLLVVPAPVATEWAAASSPGT